MPMMHFLKVKQLCYASVIAVVFITGLMGCADIDPKDKYMDLLLQGDSIAQRGDFQTAIPIYSLAISVNPDTASMAYKFRALCYYNVKLYDQGREDLLRSTTINPKDEYAQLLMARLLEASNKPKESIQYYTNALKLNPKDTTALNNRGTVYTKLGEPVLAVTDFNKLISLDSTYWVAYNNRALVYLSIKDYEHALIDYNKAIMLNPASVDAFYNRGVCYLALEMYGPALKDLTFVNDKKPSDAIVLTHKGIALYHLNEIEAAKQDWRQAATLGSDEAQNFLVKYFSGK